MNALDWVLLAVLAVAVALALWRVRKKKGCCGNCESCSHCNHRP